MSTTLAKNCGCPSPEIVTVPGMQGDPGTSGAAGANGVSPFTFLTAPLRIPASANTTATAYVLNTSWMAVNMLLFTSDGTNFATWQVAAVLSGVSVSLTWLGYASDSQSPNSISAGAVGSSSAGFVVPTGRSPKLVGVATLTNSTTGAASNTLAAGVGVQTLAIYVQLAQITGTTIFAALLGYNFKVLGIQFVVEVAVTTAAKGATIIPYINGAAVTTTGVVLTSALCTPKGTTIAGGNVTAANTGTNTNPLQLVASGVTAFVEGTGWVILTIQNMDTANSDASLASKINAILGVVT
jgi:hypothetical protein